MSIGLIIADFESSFSSSFQHTARVKYDVDFNTSAIVDITEKLTDLKGRVENKQGKPVHVGLEISMDHVNTVILRLSQIRAKYIELFGIVNTNQKIYDMNRKIRDAVSKSPEDIAREVVKEILSAPKPAKKSQKDRIKEAADVFSKQRALKAIQKRAQG